jgi:hypothetical protein
MLGGIHTIVVQLHELQLTFLFGEIFLNKFSRLIVHDVQFGFEALASQFIQALLVRNEDA